MTNDINMLHQAVVSPFRESNSVTRKDNGAQVADEQKPAGVEDPRGLSLRANAKGEEHENLQEMVSGLNDLVHELHRELQFSLDDESGEVVIKVIDRETDTVVRQLPPEEVLKLRKRLQEAAGVIFHGEA